MITEIGEALVKCNYKCQGITNDSSRGIIPRCLFIENRKGSHNCIVVGLNAGKCTTEEREFYLKRGNTYKAVLEYFNTSNLHQKPYFKRTRDLITILGFDGDILWTDLVKCECSGKNGDIPIQTMRVCINQFLRKEINAFKSPIIFALGNVAFDFCSLSFPNHFIVGIPHPSGSFGDFSKLKKKVVSNVQFYLDTLSKDKDIYNNFQAIHLSKI